MSRCPNCSYILVLLEKRGKYKCAKCSKLFLKKEIDDEEFREWDKEQRKKDEEDFNKQLKLRRKSLKPRKFDPKEKQKRLREYRLAYYERNIEKMRAYDGSRKRNRNGYMKKQYHANLDMSRILRRIRYWRQMQKELVTFKYPFIHS